MVSKGNNPDGVKLTFPTGENELFRQFRGERFFEINNTKSYKLSSATDDTGLKLIHKLAILACHEKYMEEAIDKIVEVLKGDKNAINHKTQYGWTPLMVLCRNSNILKAENIIDLFIRAGGDVNAQDNEGDTALILSVDNTNGESNERTVETLLKSGANINHQGSMKWTALMHVARYAGTYATDRTIDILLSYKPDTSLVDNDGWTALMIATRYAETSSDRIIKLLLDHDSDIDHRDKEGRTALMYAANQHKNNSIRLLLQHGANINLQDSNGFTPLILAIKSWKDQDGQETIELLLGSNPDLEIKSNEGKKASDYAKRLQDQIVTGIIKSKLEL